MQKTLTKEELAARLDGRSYGSEITLEECEVARENDLVVAVGYSDDGIVFHGAIHDETDAYDGGRIELTQAGIFQSECHDGTDCPYFRQLCRKQKVNVLKVFWCGKSKQEKASNWEDLGKPTWMFDFGDVPVATFSIYDPQEDNEYFCRGIVFDLKDLQPFILETPDHEKRS